MKGVIIGLFIIMLGGALYFSLERILFCDASFILFRILNLDTLQIQEHRYGSFITQGFPLLAGRLHLPLNTIVILYSASFNLFYLAVAALLIFRFKEYPLAILMSFYYVLFVSDTFFWTNNEIHQGIAWMFLFFGTTIFMRRKKLSPIVILPVFSLLAFLSIFTHPLVIFPALFLWLFLLLEQKDERIYQWMPLVMTLIIIIICLVKYKTSTHTSSFYDAEKLKVFREVSVSDLLHTFTSPMAREIFKRCLTNYWLVPVLMFTGIISALWKRKFKAVILVTFFCLAYFMAFCLTFQDFIPFYTESELMPFSIMAAAPFVYYTLPFFKPRTVVLILAVIFLIRLGYIANSSRKFTERKEWIFSTLQIMRERRLKKAVVLENEINRKKLIMSWGVPTESIIASALEKDRPQMSFVVMRPENVTQQIPTDPNLLFVCFSTRLYSEMNPRYFYFDTTSAYQFIVPK